VKKNLKRNGSGYQHAKYAQSFQEIGRHILLPQCQGWLLERAIDNTSYCDAMGCYPLFACQMWENLHADILALESNLVSVTIVTDPFGTYDKNYLSLCFPDLNMSYKQHFVVNLSKNPEDFVSSHHRRYAKKASRECTIELCEEPQSVADDWINLYSQLIDHRHIQGIPRFSRFMLSEHLLVPGIVVFRAKIGTESVGMTLWYVCENIAYYHLGASSDLGYRVKASFGLFWQAIHYFRRRNIEWLNLGAGPGAVGNSTDGLSEFKKGWSTDARKTYLCGRIIDQSRYLEVTRGIDTNNIDYFPPYRRGEFQ